MLSPSGRTPSPHPSSPHPSSPRPSLRTVVLIRPLIWLIRAYQLLLSPMRPPTCRFYPSCSAYAVTALERFGILRGSWLALRRLLRCHPWNPGGVDDVPQRGTGRAFGHPTHQT